MKAQIITESLQKKLPLLNHAISGRNQLPVLNNLLIEVKKGRVRMSATDLEIGIISSIPASVETEGEISVPAKTFSDLVLSVSGEKAEISLRDNLLRFKDKKTEANFQTTPADEYPKIQEEKGERVGEISREVALREMQRVVFSASQDQDRANLSGVLIKKEKNGFSLVATDGYRLSLKTGLSIGKEEGAVQQLLVPARVIRELLAIKEEGEQIEIYVSKKTNQIIFTSGDTTLVGRLIEAEYPDYEKIIPSSFSTKVEFLGKELLSAVKTCAVFARETANIVKLSILRERIIVSANTPSVGDDRVVVDAKTSGEENEIAFNARYLLDVLSVVGEEDVLFEMSGPLSPGVFKVKNDPSFLHLIMPIRVQG
jgi:DNA polymerase-3 subunit beta